jgi:hypothetical protein
MEFQGPQIAPKGRRNTGLSLVVVVKLGDHVTYYSIHDVAVSFMEIGKIEVVHRVSIPVEQEEYSRCICIAMFFLGWQHYIRFE